VRFIDRLGLLGLSVKFGVRMKISDSSIIMGSTVEHTWYELLPNTMHNLTPLVNPGNSGYRTFQHSFSTGSSTSIDMFFKTSTFTNSDFEQVIGLYKAGVSGNLLIGTANVSSVSSPVVHTSAGGVLGFTPPAYTNTTATPNVVLTGLEANTKYYIIVKTQYNEYTTVNELALALEVAGVNVPLKYEATRGLTAFFNPFVVQHETVTNARTAIATSFGPQVTLNGTDAYANPAAPAKYTLKAGQTLSTTIGVVTTAYVAGDAVPLYIDSQGFLKFAVSPNTSIGNFSTLAMADGVIELTLNTGVFSSRILPAAAPTPLISPTPVSVNLGVEVDVSGNITVFGQPTPVVSNLVIAAAGATIPVTALFTGGNGLIEFWEPLEAIGELRASLATSSSPFYTARNYKLLLPALAQGIQGVLDGTKGALNASGATPFSQSMYGGDGAYRTPANFGKLALGSYAHYLFGHIHATAAITNDQAIMNAIIDMPGLSTAPFDDANAALWSTGTPTSANIARRLVNALVTGEALTSNTGNLLSIVKQVLGQDAARAKGVDHTVGVPDMRQLLRFFAGDKIYFNIKLARPTLSVSNGQPLAGLPLATSFPADNNVNYTIQVSLA